MKIEAFRPKINEQDKFAVALPYSNGDGKIRGVSPLQTYPTLEALNRGYEEWKAYAQERRLTSPVRIEILDKEMHCRILH